MRDRVLVAFAISHACPLKCDFCCSTKDVVGGGRIRRGMIERSMVDFGADERVERFSFSGGDPFLYLREIEAGVTQARLRGVRQPFQIVTSAYWAKERTHVAETLGRLKAMGMDTICLSYDHEHARWVSPDQIRMVCTEAASVEMKVNLIGTFWEKEEKLLDLLPDLHDLPAVQNVYQFLTLPEGRAKTARPWPRNSDVRREDKYSCGRAGVYDCVIYPDGNVYPCCPGGIQIEAKLSCGNVNQDRAGAILDTVLTNFHVRFAKEFGWGVLYEIVAKDAPDLLPELPSIDAACSACEICRDLNVALAPRLKPIYERIETEYVKTRAEFEWKAGGGEERSCSDGPPITLSRLLDLLSEESSARHAFLSGKLQIGADAVLTPPQAD